MTVMTYEGITGRAPEKARKSGFFSRLYRAIVEARTREARRQVNAYLRSLDDKTLAKLGYDRAEVENLKAGIVPRH